MAIKELSQRQLKVGQEIRRIAVSLIERGEIRNLHDIKALVTLTEARISSDLKYCNIFFVSSDDSLNEKILEALQLAANHFRKQISAKTSLRFVPEIIFKIDDTFASVDKIEKLLKHDKVQRDLKISEE